MMKMDLKEFSILEGLTPEESRTILDLCDVTTIEKGEKVFDEGEPADSLYLVSSGRIALQCKASYYNGTIGIPIDLIGVGGVFGLSALVPPYHYTLTARANEDSEVLQIKQTDLQHCCETNPRLGFLMMKNISRIVGKRYEITRQMLAGEIQNALKKKESHLL